MRERRGGGSTPVYFPSVYNGTVDFYNPVQETSKRDCICIFWKSQSESSSSGCSVVQQRGCEPTFSSKNEWTSKASSFRLLDGVVWVSPPTLHPPRRKIFLKGLPIIGFYFPWPGICPAPHPQIPLPLDFTWNVARMLCHKPITLMADRHRFMINIC